MQALTNRRAVHFAAVLISFLLGSTAAAADVSGGANGVSLSGVSSSMQSVRVTGPNGYSSVSADAVVRSSDGAPLADGVYRYEVTEMRCVNVSHAEIAAAKRDNAANGRDRDATPDSCREVVVDSGAFRIVNGAVPSSALVEE